MQKVNNKFWEIISEFKNTLVQLFGEKLFSLICYGSQARGDAHLESDIDMALILQGPVRPSEEIDRVVTLIADFNLRYGVLISIMPVDKDTWEKAEGPFWRNVHREGIEI